MSSLRVENELDKLKAITRILRSASKGLETEAIARISVRELINIVDCDVCAVMLVKGDRIKILAERGFSEKYGKVVDKGRMTVIEQVLDTRQAVYLPRVQISPISNQMSLKRSVNSMICTPIMTNDTIIGIMYMDSSKKNAFNEKAMELTKLLATEVSIAFRRSLQQSQLRNTSVLDTVTGCFNRRKFNLDIVAEVATAQDYERHLSLMMVKIDCFNSNSSSSRRSKHNTLLRRLGYLLRHNLRPYDNVYRYSANEFAVLMVDTDKNGALAACKRIEKLIEREQASQKSGAVKVSIGVTSLPSDTTDGDGLFQFAELPFYNIEDYSQHFAREAYEVSIQA